MTAASPQSDENSRRILGSSGATYVWENQGLTWLPVVGSLAVIAILTGLVLLQMMPPAVVGRSASPELFSAERAIDHLQVIARAPRPTGSVENQQVRSYLVDQLRRLGLEPQVQTSTSVYHDTGKWGIPGPKGMEVGPDTWALAGATVYNIVARIPGTNSSGAVALAAHYDSVPTSPGASDDGVGVAAIIETARAILAGPPLRNDVILLITDGEEIGLMGSRAFVDNHPWMADVALVLNLEARGSGGTVLMYETSQDNAWLIREYAKAAVAPLTSSVATDVWRMMPNSTDLTLFLQDGKQGMNFAYAENWAAYHTTQDSVEDLGPRSLQHQGANVLALAKHFANLDLAKRSGGDAIFFSVMRLGIIQYPKSWALPLIMAAVLAYLLLLGIGLRANRLSLKGVGLGIAAFLCAASAAALTGFLVVRALDTVTNGTLVVGVGGTYNEHWYELGLLAIYLPVTGAIYTGFQSRARPADLAFGALFFWLLLSMISTLLLPGASYMFLWPLAAGLLVLGLYLRRVKPAGMAQRLLQPLLLLLPVTIGLVLAGTVIYLVQLMFGIGILPAGGFLTVLVLALAFPYLDFRKLPRAWAWSVVPAALGVLVVSATAVFTRTQENQPRLNFTFYSMDADTGQAAWVAETRLPDTTLAPLLGQAPHAGYLSDYFPTHVQENVWIQDAPTLAAPPPELRVVEDTINGGERTLRLRIRSPRAADGILAEVIAENAILTASVYGERYSREAPRSYVSFKIIRAPEDGVEVAVTLRAGVPVTVRLADMSRGLPLDARQRAAFESGLRSGFGGGHGVDSMTLIHRKYQIPFIVTPIAP